MREIQGTRDKSVPPSLRPSVRSRSLFLIKKNGMNSLEICQQRFPNRLCWVTQSDR